MQLHRVPLSNQALWILEQRAEFSAGSKWVFSRNDAALISDIDGRTATAHGFRSSFRDWASENLYARDLAERALAHTIQNATEAAYHRTDQLEQRRAMMQVWADFVLPKNMN